MKAYFNTEHDARGAVHNKANRLNVRRDTREFQIDISSVVDCRQMTDASAAKVKGTIHYAWSEIAVRQPNMDDNEFTITFLQLIASTINSDRQMPRFLERVREAVSAAEMDLPKATGTETPEPEIVDPDDIEIDTTKYRLYNTANGVYESEQEIDLYDAIEDAKGWDENEREIFTYEQIDDETVSYDYESLMNLGREANEFIDRIVPQ